MVMQGYDHNYVMMVLFKLSVSALPRYENLVCVTTDSNCLAA